MEKWGTRSSEMWMRRTESKKAAASESRPRDWSLPKEAGV